MLAELIALLLGTVVGTITGLVPGLHINLVSVIVIGLVSSSAIAPIQVVIFIVALAVTHTLLDFIPSIYLGAPEESTFLSVLPGHELLKEGKGHEAVVVAFYGVLISLAVLALLAPAIFYLSPYVEKSVDIAIPFVLITISTYMILREEKVIIGFLVFILAGILGFITLNAPVKEPLMPLLSGLFGASSLILSIGQQAKIPKQEITPLRKIKIERKELKNALWGIVSVGPVCSFLPAIGSGYGSLLSSELFPQTRKGFLFLNGALNMFVMGTSFLLVYSTGKARTGAAAAIQKLLPDTTLGTLITIAVTALTAALLATLIGVYVSKRSANIIEKVNYRKISLGVITILCLAVVLISNVLGAIVFITATSLGIFCISSGIKRTHLMGCLLIPTILIYL